MVFVMEEYLEQHNLLLTANSHMKPGQVLHTRQAEYLEQDKQERQLVCLFVLRFYGPVNPMGSC